MHILWMLFVGLVVGTAARLLMPGRAGGIIMTIVLGLAGSFLAGLLGRSIGWYRGGVDAPGLVASVLGAMLILFIFRLVVGRRGRGRSGASS
jgi:uncharacterized membrane protein YeaQ/YmgE (transglycosylase-associated protein family)